MDPILSRLHRRRSAAKIFHFAQHRTEVRVIETMSALPVVCRYLARFNQLFEIVQVSIDTVRDGAAKAGGQLQGHTRALVRKRRERNDSRGEMIRSAVVGKGSPGQSSLRNAQHHLKCRVMPLSVKTKRRDKMVVVQFSHAFDRGDEFWIILKRQPALVDIRNWRVDHD